jgi:hypothetical protein
MMRKTSFIFLGAIAGAGLTLLATQPPTAIVGSSAKAASSDTYRQLNLFGDVFERVRADHVDKPDNGKLVESAINGMLGVFGRTMRTRLNRRQRIDIVSWWLALRRIQGIFLASEFF